MYKFLHIFLFMCVCCFYCPLPLTTLTFESLNYQCPSFRVAKVQILYTAAYFHSSRIFSSSLRYIMLNTLLQDVLEA